MVKETGIMFSGKHPRLILDELKTMTRRTYGLDKFNESSNDWVVHHIAGAEWEFKNTKTLADYHINCPYGQIGDLLIIKETWATDNQYSHLKPSEIPRTARISYIDTVIQQGAIYYLSALDKLRSAMFMCKWMSRARLEITDIRVEHLNLITEEAAMAEGANPFLLDKLKGGNGYKMMKTYHHESYPLLSHADEGELVVFECPNMGFARLHHTQWKEGQDPVFRIPVREVFEYVGATEPDYRNGFRILWDSLNAKRGFGWDFNPWVWCILFRLVKDALV